MALYAAVMSSIDWGDVPTWLGAVFAAGAAGAAVWTLASQRQQIREQRHFIAEQSANLALEREELKATLAERREDQARRVEFSVDLIRSRERFDARAGEYETHQNRWRAVVANFSAGPLRDVSVRNSTYELQQAHWVGDAFSGGSRTAFLGRDEGTPLSVLGADKAYVFLSEPLSEDASGLERPVCYFTDNAGVRWGLDEHGDLGEVTWVGGA